MTNLIEKYKKHNEETEDLIIEPDNKLICPHCKEVIKNRELKVKKGDKYIIHGKCEGKVSFNDDMIIDEFKNLFEDVAQFAKGKMEKILSKALKTLDLSDIGNLGDTPTKVDKMKLATPLKDAKSGKNKRTFQFPDKNK